MDYAIQLLLPILGGLALGFWLHEKFGASPLWTVGLAVFGMIVGLGIMYKRLTYPELYQPQNPPKERKNASPSPHQPPQSTSDSQWEEDSEDEP